MNPVDPLRSVAVPAVVPLDRDGTFLAEAHDERLRDGQAGPVGGGQAQMFVEIVVVEAGDGRLEDVGGRRRALA